MHLLHGVPFLPHGVKYGGNGNEPSRQLLKFRPAFPGDALEVGAVFVGELAGDGVAVAVLGLVVGGSFHGADVGDGVDGEADGALMEDGGIQSACGCWKMEFWLFTMNSNTLQFLRTIRKVFSTTPQ